MVNRGVCDTERRGDQQGLVLGEIASVGSMIWDAEYGNPERLQARKQNACGGGRQPRAEKWI